MAGNINKFEPEYGVNQADNINQQITQATGSDGFMSWLINMFGSEDDELREFLYNEMAAGNARQYEEYMWNKNAEYNNEMNALERWMKAGGNPNAFFENKSNSNMSGGGSGAMGGVTSTAGITAQNFRALNDSFNQNAKLFWEIQNMKEDATKKSLENGTFEKVTETQIDLWKSQILKNQQEGNLSEAKANEILTLLPLVKDKTNAEIEQIKNNSSYLTAKTKEALSNAKYLDQRRKTEVYVTLKAEWENTFREKYGIDPTSQGVQAIIQSILSGKGDEVLGAFFGFIGDAINNIGDQLPNAGDIGYNVGKAARHIPQFRLIGDTMHWIKESYQERKKREERAKNKHYTW